MNRDQLVAKLEEIHSHYQNVQAVRKKMERYQPKDTYPRTVKVPPFPTTHIKAKDRSKFEELNHGSAHGETETENLFRKKYAPAKPRKSREKTYEPTGDSRFARVKRRGCFPIGAAFCGMVSTFFAVETTQNMSDSLDEINACVQWIIAGVFWAVVLAFVVAMIVSALRDKFEHSSHVRRLKREFEAASAKYEEDMVKYQDACRRFEPIVEEFMGEYRVWRGIYLRAQQEEERIREQLETDRATGVTRIRQNELLPAEAALDAQNNGMVTKECLPILDELISLIRAGRADSVKEAVNLYEEIQYRERRLKILQEAEAQRRYEAEEMEARRRREENQRLEEERRRERDRQWETERLARQLCSSCYHRNFCSMEGRNPSCPKYRPR